MQYDFLIGHKIRVQKKDRIKDIIIDGYDHIGTVMRVLKMEDDTEKIIFVRDDGKVGWIQKKTTCSFDLKDNISYIITILDWDSKEEEEEEEEENRFDLMDMEE